MATKLDLDALQAELRWCIDEGHSGPRTHALLKSMQPLIDRLRKAEAASKWISVDERMPESGEAVLAVGSRDPHSYYNDLCIYDADDQCWYAFDPVADDYIHETSAPTHWQPLPAAPDSTPTDSADSEGASRADQA